ncbi:hypothetical protein [Lactiplantibacillus plantarum]|uniref:hypothetical protein n=1 Tax=Lactiplantibacillus plantarum TaxID=1590 RepID=UPI00223F1A34|nr:hypothetical protein [Lactiplantibacillus plantarum]
MKFRQAQMFEYALSIFPERLSQNGATGLPTYKIIWRVGNELIVANTYQVNSFNTPFTKHVRSDGEVVSDTWTVDGEDSDLYLTRKIWFDNYENPFNNPSEIYRTPSLLLSELVRYYSDLNVNENTEENILFNVKLLKSNTELPFLLVDSDVELVPVSLISEN